MAVKKTTKRTVRNSKKKVEEIFETPVENQTSESSKPPFSKKQIIIAGVVIALLVVLYIFKGLIVAATVNGQPIFRISVINELEKQNGKRTLDSLIIKSLILQEAQKKNISVDQKEINNEINKINDSLTKQGQNLDQVLAMQGLSRSELVDQIKMQKLIEKLVGKDIKISDKEINDYIDQNKEAFPEGQSEQNKAQAREQLTQKSLSDKVQSWLADLQKNAKVSYFVNY